jgi:TATA-box binding protein (TBP) (component of TFIID and TFIIIB)
LVNVTGLKSAEEIEQQKSVIEEMFQQKVKKVRIDNTFFSKKDYKNIDMPSLYKHLKENKDYFVSYNIEVFAGMYLHPKDKQYPTMIIFRTGSYTMMGGKSLKIVYECEIFLKTLIQKYLKL